jgi:hypothetical protein
MVGFPSESCLTESAPTLGILMLDTAFPRIPGDVGNAATWPFPVRIRRVSGATPTRVTGPAVRALADAFADGARALVDEGVAGITTTCGFLAILQPELAARCAVPFAASSLLQVPAVQATLPRGQRVGVITFSAERLTPAHLEGAGAEADTPLVGLDEDSAFSRMILEGHASIDIEQAEQDVVRAGRRLLQQHPEVGAIVIECTNLPPYSAALHEAVGLPVHDAVSFTHWFHAGLAPRRFPSP